MKAVLFLPVSLSILKPTVNYYLSPNLCVEQLVHSLNVDENYE
jgi:hypothetical protein